MILGKSMFSSIHSCFHSYTHVKCEASGASRVQNFDKISWISGVAEEKSKTSYYDVNI